MTPSGSIGAALQRHFAYELGRVVREDACLAGQAVTHDPISKSKMLASYTLVIKCHAGIT